MSQTLEGFSLWPSVRAFCSRRYEKVFHYHFLACTPTSTTHILLRDAKQWLGGDRGGHRSHDQRLLNLCRRSPLGRRVTKVRRRQVRADGAGQLVYEQCGTSSAARIMCLWIKCSGNLRRSSASVAFLKRATLSVIVSQFLFICVDSQNYNFQCQTGCNSVLMCSCYCTCLTTITSQRLFF